MHTQFKNVIEFHLKTKPECFICQKIGCNPMYTYSYISHIEFSVCSVKIGKNTQDFAVNVVYVYLFKGFILYLSPLYLGCLGGRGYSGVG